MSRTPAPDPDREESRQGMSVSPQDGEVVMQVGAEAYLRLSPQQAVQVASMLIKSATLASAQNAAALLVD